MRPETGIGIHRAPASREKYIKLESPEGQDILLMIRAYRALHPELSKKEIIEILVGLTGKAQNTLRHTLGHGASSIALYSSSIDPKIGDAYLGLLQQDSGLTEYNDVIDYARGIIAEQNETSAATKDSPTSSEGLEATLGNPTFPSHVDPALLGVIRADFRTLGRKSERRYLTYIAIVACIANAPDCRLVQSDLEGLCEQLNISWLTLVSRIQDLLQMGVVERPHGKYNDNKIAIAGMYIRDKPIN